ncbi:hypothetical protein H6501_02070 [Candidatus Woesearchaeota archaeon]|nr:hypothetical protein [Nanoarchaeota archaeon]MCB9370363.1 hypothetical protein [Candidatus Woesearchaeota archaeon]USN44884.1 MAG: hypothetical protein H6500_03515 [Candidatus Woesearchaeota archaeon]
MVLNITKVGFVLFVFFSIFITVNGVGVYRNDGSFVHYVPNDAPLVDINISNSQTPFKVLRANFLLNDEVFTKEIGSSPLTQYFKEFSLSEMANGKTFSENDSLSFELILDKELTKLANSDPLSFDIVIDLTEPRLLSPESSFELSSSQNSIPLSFSEPICFLEAFLDGQSIYEKDFLTSPAEKLCKATFDLEIDSTQLSGTSAVLTLTFSDLAGITSETALDLSYSFASCSLDGVSLQHGEEFEFYSSTSAQSCESQKRVCNDGVLSGSDSYKYQSCEDFREPASCSLDGVTVRSGQSYSFYQARTSQSCEAQVRTCTDGSFSGDSSYMFHSCEETTESTCNLDGIEFASGSSWSFFSARTAAQCTSEKRQCLDGVLGGNEDFRFSSCEVVDEKDPCLLDGVSVSHGQSYTFYNKQEDASCKGETRTCNDGVFGGNPAYIYHECTVTEEPQACEIDGKRIEHEQSVELFEKREAETCLTSLRTCINGTLDGDQTYVFSTCTEVEPLCERNPFDASCPFSLKLLTKKDDSSLNYFYDKNFKNFFAGTIFTRESSISLVVQSNKPASCFAAEGFIQETPVPSFNEVLSKTKMISESGLLHQTPLLSLNALSPVLYWIACKNDETGEILYLNAELGEDLRLLKIQQYTGENLAIQTMEPADSEILTYSPFPVTASTNVAALCFLGLDEVPSYRQNALMSSSSADTYKKHSTEAEPLKSGAHSLNLLCYNKVFEEAARVHTLSLDTTKGLQISSISPSKASEYPVTINFRLSEPATCYYSLQELNDLSQITTLTQATGTGQNKQIPLLSGLIKGKNQIFIYCTKNNQLAAYVSHELFFDNSVPELSQLVFINDGIPSEYLSSNSSATVRFSYTSATPVSTFYVYFTRTDGSSSEPVQFPSSNALANGTQTLTVTEDLASFSSLSVVGQTTYGKNTSPLTKTLLFDFQVPSLEFSLSGTSLSILCTDAGSGCYDILYDTKAGPLGCVPSLPYSENSSIQILDYTFVCAKARDKAGNSVEFSQYVGEIGDNGGTGPVIDEEEEEEGDYTQPGEEEEEGEYEEEEDDNSYEPITLPPENTSGNFPYLIVVALILVLAGVGGSGYYAYRKGYLDKQLKKFGIEPKGTSNRNTFGDTQKGSQTFTTSRSEHPQYTGVPRDIPTNQSKYDTHLNRLNTFIDEKIKHSEELAKAFDKKKNNEDSLMKTTPKRDVSQEDFDEYYQKQRGGSSGLGNNKNVATAKNEAEQFENFLSKKKASEKEEKTKKSS